MSCSGTVKSFNGQKGFGFIDFEGTDVFVHMKDCQGGVPDQGDTVYFDVEDSPAKPGSKRATNVTGGSGAARGVQGSGSAQGTVVSFNPVKGFGFINCQGTDVFVHINDCRGGCPAQGDVVAFDIEDSASKPGTKKASNVTGGTGSLADAKGGGKGGGKGDGGYGPMCGGKGGGGWGMGGWGKGGMMGGMMGPYGGGWGKGGGGAGGWGKGWGKGW
eukprot:CAMPEP_0179263686 /NCGR_PEP_ID=MMETSP0797-20121207/28007_1 /TAXON_ID=47934 /ORGANISM="Dinophysis acuminata, Strain DAEP01" /LENGTH=215 /DNA_ID=CAMNT_0020971853 /DNA_START=40 /DNA_END=687 /DNA_ORIENTATION=-